MKEDILASQKLLKRVWRGCIFYADQKRHCSGNSYSAHLGLIRFTLTAVLTLCVTTLFGQIYVDQAHTGTETGSFGSPFKTIQQAAAVAQPGTTVYVRAGTYRESVVPANSGAAGSPITFMPYEGEEVTISGGDLITDWTPATDLPGTYVANVPSSFQSLIGQNEQVFVDGVMVHLARHPNFNDITDLSHPVKFTADRLVGHPSYSGSSEGNRALYTITFEDDALLEQDINWTGARIQINERVYNYVNGVKSLNANGQEVYFDPFFQPRSYTVLSHEGNKITFLSISDKAAISGMEYFLFDHKEALDSNGEWWLDKSVTPHKLYLRTPDGSDPNNHEVEFKKRDWAFNLDPGNFESPDNGRSYITIKGFQLRGCSISTDKNAAYGGATSNEYPWRNGGPAKSKGVVIDGLSIKYVTHFYSVRNQQYFVWSQTGGVVLSGSDHLIQNCTISYSAGNGIVCIGRRNKVLNNVIHDVGYADVETGFISTGPVALSEDHEIGYNTCYNAARNAISIRNLKNSSATTINTRIHHNKISNYGIQAIADIGAIYNAYLGNNNRVRIDHNLIFNDNHVPVSGGIYIDYGDGYLIDHNVVYDVETSVKYNNSGNTTKSYLYNNTFLARPSVPWASYHVYVNHGGGKDEGLIIKNNIGNTDFYTGSGATKTNNLGGAPDSIFVNKAAGNLQLTPNATQAINKGQVIRPYTDGYVGTAPDLGAYETGAPTPHIGATGPYQPVLAAITLSPYVPMVASGATRQFKATGLDQFGIELAQQSDFTWAVIGNGSISSTGLYTAPFSEHVDTIQVSYDSIVGYMAVDVRQIFAEATVGEAATANLTEVGKADWIHWGNKSPQGTDRKTSGSNQISTYTTLGSTTANAFPYPSSAATTGHSLIWSDGAPNVTHADSVRSSGVFVKGGVGSGFSISTPSNPSFRTLTLYVGGYKASGRLTITQDDGGDPFILYTDTTGYVDSQFDRTYTVTYKTNEKTRLTVSWVMQEGQNDVSYLSMSGAALSFKDSVRVVTSITVSPASTEVDLGLTKQFKAQAFDQDNTLLNVQPSFTWSVSGGGTIDNNGLFTAGETVGGPFTVTATSSGVSSTASVRTTDVAAKIRFTKESITVDGTIDAAWDQAFSYSVSKKTSGTVSSVADLSGTFRTLFDSTNLYVLFEVTDDSVVVDAGPWYDNDGIEVYIDRGNKKNEAYGADDFQWAFKALADQAVIEGKGKSAAGVSYAKVNTATGYIIEIVFPWTSLGGMPANKALGFDAQIIDDDDGDGREGKMAWWGITDNAWTSPTKFGLAKLVQATGSSDTDTTTGTGLTAEYFNNRTVTPPAVITRIDPVVNFNWMYEIPMAGVYGNGFSARWSGQIEAPVSGDYTFTTVSDDGIRLWVNNTQIINNWTDHATASNTSLPITLTQGVKYPITLEFYENTGWAEARLKWSYPGQALEVIPSLYLYPVTTSSARRLGESVRITDKSTMVISPNPATEFLSISSDANLLGTTLILTDLTGRTVEKVNIHTSTTTHKFNVRGLSQGVYVLQVQSLKETAIFRVLIAK